MHFKSNITIIQNYPAKSATEIHSAKGQSPEEFRKRIRASPNSFLPILFLTDSSQKPTFLSGTVHIQTQVQRGSASLVSRTRPIIRAQQFSYCLYVRACTRSGETRVRTVN